jgi:hypothetical protein
VGAGGNGGGHLRVLADERQGVFTTAHIECKDFSQGYAPKHSASIQEFPR